MSKATRLNPEISPWYQTALKEVSNLSKTPSNRELLGAIVQLMEFAYSKGYSTGAATEARYPRSADMVGR